ncbi:osmotically-inducible lipoprotein OsmE [Dickeya dianthicola]|uniref:osmotically-inducible lipoprotein OsmE n=1 Tax=Dickeya dianthicola TaxID=204039 RepID=UPI001367E34F|nr:osmotically-inducible lipoprotein OsmE [Dickeya dianthicola]MCI4068389.1 osmotically-inducible lipoprotein OsmE [Dickeya dianthicola]MCI4237926.1 osmotically-inducible lipoprotein OsmE [Dickeya dianthicola]MCI4257240.1 osmotically-inducible lipoprotein OsmE [Dickeya dianthicola]MZG20769.1 osmotically-inducible lipoprotein OsmE [Dickeya dianthicola]MZI91347.1 osmotically-inducible lipoprotein OsmE [Dickeya dianthicola]
MKKNRLLMCIAASALMLSGCVAYDRAENFLTKPVVKDVKKGMSRQEVKRIAGPASTQVTMIHARGTCNTYVLGTRDGKIQYYFVSFDETDHVLNKGFQSCQEYDVNPKL